MNVESLPGVKEVLAYLNQEFVGEFYAKERTRVQKTLHPVAMHKILVDEEKMLGLRYAPSLKGNTVVDVMISGPHRIFPHRIAQFRFSTADIWDDAAQNCTADTFDFTLLRPDKLKELLKEYL